MRPITRRLLKKIVDYVDCDTPLKDMNEDVRSDYFIARLATELLATRERCKAAEARLKTAAWRDSGVCE